jgi:UDP-glucuronate 4-epimerase
MTVISILPRSEKPSRSILVTGGAGFIGSHLVDSLLAEGCWRVIVVDSFDDFYAPAIKRANVAAHLSNPDFRLYEADIRDAEGLRRIFADNAGISAIVHLAARAGVRPSLQQPQAYLDVNVSGTLNLLECARAFGVRQFVFGSSSSVYGAGTPVPFAEAARTASPISPYAASKAAAELLCHTYAHLYDVRCVCLRFFTVYGPRQRPDLAIHKFARLIRDAQPIPLFGDGSSRRDYTYVDDIVLGIRAAVDYRRAPYDVFNLGESQTITLADLIALLEQSLGRRALLDPRPEQPGDMAITYADVSKAARLLGYKPKTKIHNGIPKFVQWFLADDVHAVV